jgi:TonB family protein
VNLLAMNQQRVTPPPVPVGTPEPKRERPPVVNEKPEPAKPFGVPSERVEAITPKKARKVADGPAVVAIANPAGVRPIEGSETAKDMQDVVGREAKPAVQAPPPPKPTGAPPVPEANVKPSLLPPVVQASAPPQPQVVRQAESGGRPGQATPAADPAPMSDSEADAFSKVVNVEFRNGRVEAQTGRRIKTVRPKLLLSAQYELFTQDNPRVLLSAKVDETGHVTKVDIYQSSGTPDLDQPCLVALYDWWFEPPKGKDGKPVADVVVVAITFRNK